VGYGSTLAKLLRPATASAAFTGSISSLTLGAAGSFAFTGETILISGIYCTTIGIQGAYVDAIQIQGLYGTTVQIQGDIDATV